MGGTLVYIDAKNFKQEVEESDIPVIMDFWAEWCAPCKIMGPVFEQMSIELKGKMKFAKVDVTVNQDLAKRYQIQGIPTLVITNKGEEIDRIVGFAPKEILKASISDIIHID